MKIIRILFAVSAMYFTFPAAAAHVECVVSGTPTPQVYTADFCSSQVNSQPSVWFRLVADKPVHEVSWSNSGEPGVSWSCSGGTYCVANFVNYTGAHGFSEVSACVGRVLYTDNTWEDLNVCASGMIYGNIFPF